MVINDEKNNITLEFFLQIRLRAWTIENKNICKISTKEYVQKMQRVNMTQRCKWLRWGEGRIDVNKHRKIVSGLN